MSQAISAEPDSERVAGQLLGLTIFAGYGMTLQFYSEALVSVWCFFAAIASALIYLHVARLAPQRAQNPVPQK